MKIKAFIAATLAVIALCSISTVEARCHRSSHFSLNLGALVAPAPAPVYVVDPYAAYVQPAPVATPVYVVPRPVAQPVYVVPARPAYYQGASFSLNFFR